MDRTDVTPDPDDVLEEALTDPESFDAARTARLVAQLEHNDADVRRAASWALRFVIAESPSLVSACAGRFRRALRDPDAQTVTLRTLAVVAERNRDAVDEIIAGAVEDKVIDRLVGRRIVAGYQFSTPGSGGSVVTDEGDETQSPTTTAGSEEGARLHGPSSDDVSGSSGHPPSEPPTKPPRLDRSLTEYKSATAGGEDDGLSTGCVRFTEGGREFTGTRWRAKRVSSANEGEYQSAIDRWCRIDDHDAVARVVDHETRPMPWLIAERGASGSLVGRDTPLPPLEARWVSARIADALHYAHTAGVLHGGLHPGAVTFVTAVEDPGSWAYPRVGNWGLREVFGPTEEPFDLPRRYAAPEHIAPDRFGGVDAATDIYGLGVIGYELLTGNAPVREDGTVRPAQAVTPGVPTELSTALTKCLRTSKMDRYASAAAFQRDLSTGDSDE